MIQVKNFVLAVLHLSEGVTVKGEVWLTGLYDCVVIPRDVLLHRFELIKSGDHPLIADYEVELFDRDGNEIEDRIYIDENTITYIPSDIGGYIVADIECDNPVLLTDYMFDIAIYEVANGYRINMYGFATFCNQRINMISPEIN